MTNTVQFMHKVCPSCGTEKPASAYNKRRTLKGTVVLASKCRECQKSYARDQRERQPWQRVKRKPIKKHNPVRQAKRDAGYRKHLKSPAYRKARNERLQIAGGRCEFKLPVTKLLPQEIVELPNEAFVRINGVMYARCLETEKLQFHERHYVKTGRTVLAEDGEMCCSRHHQYTEATKFGYRHTPGRT